MNAKLFRYTIYLTLLPVSGVLWAVALRYNINTAVPMLCLLAALQLSVLLLCKRSLMNFVHPDTAVLSKMGIPCVPVAYQPGRCKVEARVCSVTMYLSLLPPALIWLACQFPETIDVGGLHVFTYATPNLALMASALVLLAVGVLSFPVWFQAARAAAIFAEGSDKKRYLMRGFVDHLDKHGSISAYLDGCKGKFFPNNDNACYWVTH